jgi:hypothetical protein
MMIYPEMERNHSGMRQRASIMRLNYQQPPLIPVAHRA